jgi:predicted dehydrogenase
MVINLTNPRSHFEISKACLLAGKHVYSEKPLAMTLSDAQELVDLAHRQGLVIASAPSRILAETGQTMWKALRENVIGKVYAVYAEMDGGLIHQTRYREWSNELGIPWPYRDEFEVGCTIEHAGYPISWLTAYFGQVDSVTSFATCQVPDKDAEMRLNVTPPDLTVACLKFHCGVVARLTSSWIAPGDHSMRIMGDNGVLMTPDLWQPRSPVYIRRDRTIRIWRKSVSFPWKTKYPMLAPKNRSRFVRAVYRPPADLFRSIHARMLHLRGRVDFCLGPREVADSIREQRPCRLSPSYCLHNTELVLAIHNARENGDVYKVQTTVEPMAPMPWALP